MSNDRITLNIFPSLNCVYENSSLQDSFVDDRSFVLGVCPWLANPDLLFRGDFFCGLSWPIAANFSLLVMEWVDRIDSKFLRVVPRFQNETFYAYYTSEKVDHFLQFLWIDSDPDGALFAALCEDCWMYNLNQVGCIDGVVSISLEGISSIALDYGLLLPTKEGDEINEDSITFSTSINFISSQ